MYDIIFGSLIFAGSDQDLAGVKKFIEMDDAINGATLITDPVPYDLYEGAVKYSVTNRGSNWIDIVALQQQLSEMHIDVEIVLALTDGSGFVDVITTNGDPDIECFENEDAEVMKALSEQYGFDMTDEEIDSEEDYVDELDYDDSEWED